MGYVFIRETADRVGNGIHISYVIQKLIPKSFSLAGSFNQARDIEKFEGGGNHFFGMDQIGNTFQPLICNGDNPYVRVNRTESVTRDLCPSCGQGIKYCRFPDIRKTNNATSETHSSP
jgi:hypothetical protein